MAGVGLLWRRCLVFWLWLWFVVGFGRPVLFSLGVWERGQGAKGRGGGFGRRSQQKEHILITFRGCIGILGDLELYIALHYLRVTSVLREMESAGELSHGSGSGMGEQNRCGIYFASVKAVEQDGATALCI